MTYAVVAAAVAVVVVVVVVIADVDKNANFFISKFWVVKQQQHWLCVGGTKINNFYE